jgi:hypothetical protein
MSMPHNSRVGDVLEIEITGIGLLRNKVVGEGTIRREQKQSLEKVA